MQVNLAVAIFVGVLFWGWLWGVPGLMVAVPLIMIMNVICDHVDALHPIAVLLKGRDHVASRQPSATSPTV